MVVAIGQASSAGVLVDLVTPRTGLGVAALDELLEALERQDCRSKRAISSVRERAADGSVSLFAELRRQRYRARAARWKELGRTARLAVVFAEFTRIRRSAAMPIEVPLPATAPSARDADSLLVRVLAEFDR